MLVVVELTGALGGVHGDLAGLGHLCAAGVVFLVGGSSVEYWWPAVAFGLAVWSYTRRPSWAAAAVAAMIPHASRGCAHTRASGSTDRPLKMGRKIAGTVNCSLSVGQATAHMMSATSRNSQLILRDRKIPSGVACSAPSGAWMCSALCRSR